MFEEKRVMKISPKFIILPPWKMYKDPNHPKIWVLVTLFLNSPSLFFTKVKFDRDTKSNQ
jgi:hypothetical protein